LKLGTWISNSNGNVNTKKDKGQLILWTKLKVVCRT